jgi:hypothetical protein
VSCPVCVISSKRTALTDSAAVSRCVAQHKCLIAVDHVHLGKGLGPVDHVRLGRALLRLIMCTWVR